LIWLVEFYVCLQKLSHIIPPQEGNTPLDIAMIEEHHECVSCLGRQYTHLQSDLNAANNRDQRDEELIQEITRQIASQRNS
jgi:hypothetical protein